MIFGAVSDIHARGKDLASLALQLEQVTIECVKHGVEVLLIPGDVFDRPGIGDSHASTGAIAEVVCGWAADYAINTPIYMIPGNHDLAGSGSKDALHVLDEISGVRVFHEPYAAHADGIEFHFLPWQWAGDPQQAILNLLNSERILGSKKVLVAHIQVIGAMHGAVACEAKPGAWQVSRDFLASLPIDRFFLGDFHRRQEIVPGRGGYVGALRQLNFGESENPAGMEIWNSATGAVEWIEIGAAPKYRTLVFDNPDHEKIEADPARENIRIQYKCPPDPVRVRVLESQGIQVEQIIERQERVLRAEVQPGILADKHALMRLWAATQTPEIEQERVERMLGAYDWLFADKKKEAA